MTWLKRTHPRPRHTCDLPMQDLRVLPDLGQLTPRPEGEVGDVWRCDGCGMVWEVTTAQQVPEHIAIVWKRAGWWTRLRYGSPAPKSPEQALYGPVGPFALDTSKAKTVQQLGKEMSNDQVNEWGDF